MSIANLEIPPSRSSLMRRSVDPAAAPTFVERSRRAEDDTETLPPVAPVTPAPRPAHAWPVRLALVLGVGAALLVSLGLVGQWLERVRGVQHSFGFVFQFAPDEEGNLATWYSSALLLTCALLFGAIAWRCPAAGERYRRHWAGLAVLLALMSADETAQMHEMLIAPLRAIWHTGGVFHFAWVIPGMAFACCVGLACLAFARALPPRTRLLLILASAVYLGGALGVEMAGGYYASRWGSASFAYGLLTSVEEAMELAGAVLLAYGLADHLSRLGGGALRA